MPKPSTDSPGKTPAQLAKLAYLNVSEALDSLPPERRESYTNAQQSVVDARRSAERHEGHLRIN